MSSLNDDHEIDPPRRPDPHDSMVLLAIRFYMADQDDEAPECTRILLSVVHKKLVLLRVWRFVLPSMPCRHGAGLGAAGGRAETTRSRRESQAG